MVGLEVALELWQALTVSPQVKATAGCCRVLRVVAGCCRCCGYTNMTCLPFTSGPMAGLRGGDGAAAEGGAQPSGGAGECTMGEGLGE